MRDDHAALDIVQDAMLKLAEKYPDRPVTEFPMLFHRILQNTTKDFWRRQKVRNLWTTLFSSFTGKGEEGGEHDILETYSPDDREGGEEPDSELERTQTIAIIEEAIKKLPTRQREAFVLRYWEDMNVAETATTMGCSEGSVKTHCSRAVRALAVTLEQQGFSKALLDK